jgi:hypothetical protein
MDVAITKGTISRIAADIPASSATRVVDVRDLDAAPARRQPPGLLTSERHSMLAAFSIPWWGPDRAI